MDISDVMTRDVVFVTPDTTLYKAARMMIDGGFSGLPVLEDGRLIGVISEADFVSKEGSQTWASRVLMGEEEDPLRGVEKVHELMSAPAVTIADTATVQEAARLMTKKGLKRLPVLNHEHELVGICTRRDLIRAYVRPDADIEGEVNAMLAVLPSPLSSVAIEVEEGVVTISGYVDTSAEARAICRLAKGIEGVAKVENKLDWEIASELGDNPWAGYALEGQGMVSPTS